MRRLTELTRLGGLGDGGRWQRVRLPAWLPGHPTKPAGLQAPSGAPVRPQEMQVANRGCLLSLRNVMIRSRYDYRAEKCHLPIT
jgi:hypothetical protein